MNFDPVTLYQNNQSLIQSNHPALHEILPPAWQEEWNSSLCTESVNNRDQAEPISLDITPHFLSRTPRYAVIFGMSSFVGSFYMEHSSTLHGLLIVEPDIQSFAVQLGTRSWSKLLRDERVRLFVGPQWKRIQESLAQDVTEIGAWGIHAWRKVNARERSKNAYQEWEDMLRNAVLVARENVNVQIKTGEIIQKNVIRNIPSMIRANPLSQYENTCTNVPAVVIGAGPSLNKNIEALRHASAGTLLLATDTSLKVLLAHGIQPHFVVTCDPLPINFRHFESIPSLHSTILAYLPDTYWGILEQYNQHSPIVCLHDLQSKLLQQIASCLHITTLFHRRMNVGYCAFMLARCLGCSPIILAGMDLAIDPAGLSHAEGTANASRIQLSRDGMRARLQGNVETGETPLVTVDGYDGQPIKTFSYFYPILRAMEKTIAEMSEKVIDSTEGGALKQGTIQMPLQDALWKYRSQESVQDRLNRIPHNPVSVKVPSLVQKLTEIKKGLQQAKNQLKWGKMRIEQWKQSLEQQGDRTAVRHQAQIFFDRWKELLASQAVDIGIDIGLAKWRYAAWRLEPPLQGAAQQLGEWWYEQFQTWLDEFNAGLDSFLQDYRWAIQRLQKTDNPMD